nr:MAG TPA: hypothetical protein [Caudoviricetes sp.]
MNGVVIRSLMRFIVFPLSLYNNYTDSLSRF